MDYAEDMVAIETTRGPGSGGSLLTTIIVACQVSWLIGLVITTISVVCDKPWACLPAFRMTYETAQVVAMTFVQLPLSFNG